MACGDGKGRSFSSSIEETEDKDFTVSIRCAHFGEVVFEVKERVSSIEDGLTMIKQSSEECCEG